MKLKHLKIYLIISILILLLIFIVVDSKKILHSKIITNENCIIKEKLKEVRGNSLYPLIISGQEINLLYGYYDCYDVERGDIIAYDYAGNSNPIIKIVKAIPGDEWKLEKQSNGMFQIIVNDKLLKNSQEELYEISESKIKMLKIYTRDYPVLPEDTYFILGNRITGSLDGTSFGLIHKNDIFGKIEK